MLLDALSGTGQIRCFSNYTVCISNTFAHKLLLALIAAKEREKNPSLLLQFTIIHLLIITPRQNSVYVWCKPDLESDLWTTWLSVSPLPCSLLLPSFCPSPHLSIYHPHGQRKSINPSSSHPSLFWTAKEKEGCERRRRENLGLLSFTTLLSNCTTMHAHKIITHAFTHYSTYLFR